MNRKWITFCLATFLPFTAIASDHDFDDAVSSIEQTYHVHRQHVPMIGFVSFCAHVATGGAVKGIKIAEFDEGSRLPADADLPALLKDSLGANWSLIVESRSKSSRSESGEQDAIYALPHGERMTLLVASYDHDGLAIVRLDLNASQFRKWMDDPVHHARHHETD
jgi:hypothetical protein